jgi:LmbE family N-acetylglucosaminyl deacetylase
MKVRFQPNRVLVLAPHTDDGELGAGGLLSKLIRGGADKRYVAFSSCKESVPQEFPSDILVTEARKATKCLGFRESDLTVFDFPVRNFPAHRQEILEIMLAIKREYAPDLVLAPTSYDVHQDHSAIHQEAVRAFKDCTLLGYELPWNCIDFRSDLVFEIDQRDLAAKVQAIRCYQSQAFRRYCDGEYLANLARLRGSQIGAELAEAYQVIRWVWRLE